MLPKLDSLHETNPKAFWQTINSLKNTDKTANNPVSLSKWSAYFSELLNRQSEMLNLQNEERTNRNISLLDFEFTKIEVYDRIKALKNNKRAGLGMIPNEIHQIFKPSSLGLSPMNGIYL